MLGRECYKPEIFDNKSLAFPEGFAGRRPYLGKAKDGAEIPAEAGEARVRAYAGAGGYRKPGTQERSAVTLWRGSWARAARRRPWLIGALAAASALVVISGLAGARYVDRFRPVRLDSGCYQVKVTPDQRRLFVLNADNSLTAVNSMTGQVEKTTRTSGHLGGESDEFLIAPDGRTIYVADSFKGVVVIPVPY
jgi:hypothetical protein